LTDDPAVEKLGDLFRLLRDIRQIDAREHQAVHAMCVLARNEFHEILGCLYAPAFNAYIVNQPHDTVDKKRQISRNANEYLRQLGLAIGVTAQRWPAILRGEHSHESPVGWFQLEVRDSAGRKKRFQLPAEWPQFELVARPERQELIADYWKERHRESPRPDKVMPPENKR
jgi:hypothetical protein